MTVYAPTNPQSYTGPMMAKGRRGEAFFCAWLASTGWFGPVKDLRDDQAARRADIDFEALHLGTRHTFTFEVKTDRFGQTGKIAFEFARFYHQTQQLRTGWGWFSQANFLASVDLKAGQIWLVRFDHLRVAVNGWLKTQRRRARVEVVGSDQAKTTYIHIIPKAVLDPIPSFCVIEEEACPRLR